MFNPALDSAQVCFVVLMKTETPELAGLLAREQAIRRETEILRDANIALTQNLSLERVLETLLDFLARLVPYDSANCIRFKGYYLSL